MKIVIRNLGSFLVAAIATSLILSLVCFVLIPALSQHITKTFPNEQNLEFNSVVFADPDPEHATPSNGDKYQTDYYTYVFDSSAGGWIVSVNDKTKTEYSALYAYIYGQRVVSIKETFKGCTAMVQAPAVPRGIKDMTSAFEGCTSLTGMLTVYAVPEQYSNCFNATAKDIYLTGSSTLLPELADTAPAENVSIK